jgi:hypothetical protein
MICDKCDYEYEIGPDGSYKNVYGTRCQKCNHLIRPDQEPKFIRDNNKKINELISEMRRIWLKGNKE